MFDTRAFLKDRFKTPERLVWLLSVYGLAPPQKEAVKKWWSRASVSSGWLAVLVCVLEMDEGRPVSLAKHTTKKKGGGNGFAALFSGPSPFC